MVVFFYSKPCNIWLPEAKIVDSPILSWFNSSINGLYQLYLAISHLLSGVIVQVRKTMCWIWAWTSSMSEPLCRIDRPDRSTDPTAAKKMPWGEAGMWRDFLNDFNGKIPILFRKFCGDFGGGWDDFGGENHRCHWPFWGFLCHPSAATSSGMIVETVVSFTRV